MRRQWQKDTRQGKRNEDIGDQPEVLSGGIPDQ